MVQNIFDDFRYDRSGGTKLRLVHPPEAQEMFNYAGASGAFEVKLAPFGRFQTGTSIQAPVYMLRDGFNGCDETDMNDEKHVHGQGGFIFVWQEECTFE